MNEESHALIKMELKSVPTVDSSKNQSVGYAQEQDNTRPSTSNENAKKSKAIEVVFIIPFCMIGALCRMGLDMASRDLESLAGFPIYKSYFSNLLGCFLIGCFGTLPKSNFKTALTTGLCGCLTTYSG